MHGNYVNDFFEKILIWHKWAILGPKMVHSHSPRSTPRTFLKGLHNERGQETCETYVNGFCEKLLIWGKCVSLARKWHIVVILDSFKGFF